MGLEDISGASACRSNRVESGRRSGRNSQQRAREEACESGSGCSGCSVWTRAGSEQDCSPVHQRTPSAGTSRAASCCPLLKMAAVVPWHRDRPKAWCASLTALVCPLCLPLRSSTLLCPALLLHCSLPTAHCLCAPPARQPDPPSSRPSVGTRNLALSKS